MEMEAVLQGGGREGLQARVIMLLEVRARLVTSCGLQGFKFLNVCLHLTSWGRVDTEQGHNSPPLLQSGCV